MSNTLDAIALPEDLHWSDEYQWSPVARAAGFLLSGAAIIEETVKQAGRPITLTGDWASKAQVDALRAKELVDADMTLTWQGVPRTVRFRGDNAVQAATVIPQLADPDSATYYTLTIRLIEV